MTKQINKGIRNVIKTHINKEHNHDELTQNTKLNNEYMNKENHKYINTKHKTPSTNRELTTEITDQHHEEITK